MCRLPVLVLQSGADECVPSTVDAPALGRRLCAAMSGGAGSGDASGAGDPRGNIIGRRDKSTGGADGAGESIAAGKRAGGLAGDANATLSARLVVIPGAGHACEGQEVQLVDAVMRFLADITP